MLKTIVAPVAALALGGCASHVLQSYVGKDLGEVAQRFGPPAARMHLPSGAEGFQWVIATRSRPATSAPLSTFLPLSSAPLHARRTAAAAGVLMGGMCVYTVFARPGQAAGTWKVVGYRAPRIDCD